MCAHAVSAQLFERSCLTCWQFWISDPPQLSELLNSPLCSQSSLCVCVCECVCVCVCDICCSAAGCLHFPFLKLAQWKLCEHKLQAFADRVHGRQALTSQFCSALRAQIRPFATQHRQWMVLTVEGWSLHILSGSAGLSSIWRKGGVQCSSVLLVSTWCSFHVRAHVV